MEVVQASTEPPTLLKVSLLQQRFISTDLLKSTGRLS